MSLNLLRKPEAAAEAAGLVYVSDALPGIRRVRRGSGFAYVRPDGSPASERDLARIAALAIPPAWTDVWICPSPNGHLQATGRDARGRKQYRYHPDWMAVRSGAKYEKLAPFGEALPDLRARVEGDLRRPTLDREKVLALAVALLDQTLIRIGNPEYAEENETYGLTTLRDKHVALEGTGVRFAFTGKSGVEHEVTLRDRRLARLVKACRDLPGHTLFQYYADGGERCVLTSGDVNAYLRETTSEEFTAKDFRTWGGTVLAAKALCACGPCEDEKAADKAIAETIKEVAAALGNTCAVCRKHYVHPAVLDAYREGSLLDVLARRHVGNTPRGLAPPEAAVLTLLKERAA
ncbi:MAG TPA: hypothetical protein VD962_01315 [Rubricoccaceae bacterium]|nr:hypothetical protein [Rubricoccaceae bacterium]